MPKIKITIILILVIGLLVGCGNSLPTNDYLNADLLLADQYNIAIVDGNVEIYNLSFDLEEVFVILVEIMTSLGILSEPESVGFIIDESLYTINDVGYFYCIQTYDTVHAASREYVSIMQTFYVNGYTGKVYQVEIDLNAKTYLTKLE